MALSAVWRPLTVAVVVTGATLLPQGVAEAAVPEGGNCVRSSFGDMLDRLGSPRTLAHPLPGRLLDLKNWKLTLPTGKKGKPEEIEGPDLSAFTNDFFNPKTNQPIGSATATAV